MRAFNRNHTFLKIGLDLGVAFLKKEVCTVILGMSKINSVWKEQSSDREKNVNKEPDSRRNREKATQ
jgi:hypothetical protein